MVTGSQDMIGFHVAGATPAGSGRVGDSNPIFVGKPYRCLSAKASRTAWRLIPTGGSAVEMCSS